MIHGKQNPATPTKAAIHEEGRRIRAFRFLTDLTYQRLHIEEMPPEAAIASIDGLRRISERLFPGKTHVFDLVVAPRLHRVLRERYGDSILSSLTH